MLGGTGSNSNRMQAIEEMKEVGINGQLSALIVDDDPLIRILHTAILKPFGLTTQVAKNGKEAIDLFNSGAKFDVVIIDRDMPVMNGIEATKQLRDMGVTCKIVGVTSRGNDAEEKIFVQAGLDLFHEKPLTAAKIRPFIMQLQE